MGGDLYLSNMCFNLSIPTRMLAAFNRPKGLSDYASN